MDVAKAETFDVRIIDEISDGIIIEFQGVSQQFIDELYGSVGELQAVEII